MTSPLSKRGEVLLAKAEATIEAGLATFWDVGNALMGIRDSRLYRAEFDTFEDYCQTRWSMSRRRAGQLVEAAQMGTMVPIENERQARALAPLKADPAEVREAFAEAQKRGDTTGAGIAKVVAERTEPKIVGGGDGRKESTPLEQDDAPENEPVAPVHVDALTPEIICPTCHGTGIVNEAAA